MGCPKRRKHAIALTLLLASPTFAIWPFPPKRFRGNSLIEAGSMGLDEDSRVVAFGDFNGDQFLDILLLGPDQQTLSTWLWDHEKFLYEKSSTFQHTQRIHNVVPGDFTHDGKLDLLVMSQSPSHTQLEMALYTAFPDGGFDTKPIFVPPSTLSQPIPVDANGDMKIDLLGATPSAPGTLRLWQNVWNSTLAHSTMFNLIEPKFNGQQCTLASPHSNAVVDLNGDCLADVFLVCDDGGGKKSFQIWTNQKDAGFSLARTGPLPDGVQSITFADIDRDGTVDMVFPTCSSVSMTTGVGTECYINIAYNKQLPLCTSSTPGTQKSPGVCRPPDDLCTSDKAFQFDLEEREDNDAFIRIPVSSIYSTPDLLVYDTTYTPPLPLPIKLGDANLDGFPDILAITVIPTTNGRGQAHTPRLAFSVACARGVPGCRTGGGGRRGWRLAEHGAEPLEAIGDARGVAFVDMDEDGTLDVMVQRTGQEGRGTISFVQNNFYYDAFFLKAIVLNGACDNGWCTAPNGSARYHPFGVSYSGATYKYTVLDTSGRRSAAQIGQLPQTSYHALQTPYAFFGLGRTNNYIENLFVGSTKHAKGDGHYVSMEGVIPNSKVVILPPPGGEEGVWKKELFLRPGAWIPWVTVTVVVGTVLLAIIVFVLHLNEKREDELERRRASHHINFDAL